ncbi:hypothetical protein BD408DRAFT_414178 [Parasitella parasitica]|nr:hypothetical protein BD408DRAFT_414178 [Parasitella parasitica]
MVRLHSNMTHVSYYSRIDSVGQLKAKLCSLHVPAQEQKNDILDIIEYEKHGHPPSIVVVIDLFAYLMLGSTQNNELQYLTTSFNELSNLLACLLESCIYLSTKNRVNMNHFIELILTDSLPSNMEEMPNAFQKSHIEKLYKILNYHLNHVYS